MSGQPLHILATTEGQTKTFMEKVEAKRKGRLVQLEDDACSGLSIYLLKADGTLWTIIRQHVRTENGMRWQAEQHRQVRDFGKPVACGVYLCLCCKAQSVDIGKLKHKQEKQYGQNQTSPHQ